MFLTTPAHSVTLKEGVITWEAKMPSPLTISIPHDGALQGEFLGLFPERTQGSKIRDLHVWPIARDLLSMCNANIVRGLVPRRFLDYNRPWPQEIPNPRGTHPALEDEQWLPSYLQYHNEIGRLVFQGRNVSGPAATLLIDLHGFRTQTSDAPCTEYDLIFGTAHRRTILSGEPDRLLAAHLREIGYTVFLPEARPREEAERYTGGYTIRFHALASGVNTLQIEIASRFRMREGKALGQKLAGDLAEGLLKLHIPS